MIQSPCLGDRGSALRQPTHGLEMSKEVCRQIPVALLVRDVAAQILWLGPPSLITPFSELDDGITVVHTTDLEVSEGVPQRDYGCSVIRLSEFKDWLFATPALLCAIV